MAGRLAGLRLLLLLALLALAAEARPAAAAGPGVVEGRLVNGTADGGSVGGLTVTLLAFRGEQEQARQSATADADGAFRFDGLDTSAGYTYQLIAPYSQVEYGGTPIVFGPGEAAKNTELRVYETTEADPGLRIDWAMVVFDQVDQRSQTVTAFELLTLVNPSDHTFVPTTTGPSGPMGLLRFSLPSGAGQLTPGPGLGENDLFQVDRGFATSDPVLPGLHELGFRYTVPYRGKSLSFERSIVYDTGELWVLVREDGPAIVSDALQEAEPLTLGGVRYRVLASRSLAAGARVTLDLTGLQSSLLDRLPLQSLPSQTWGVASVALALVIVGAYGWRRYRQSPLPATSDPRTQLIGALATLDEERDAGRLSAEEHERRRAALKAAVRDVYLAQHLPVRQAGGMPTRAAQADEA